LLVVGLLGAGAAHAEAPAGATAAPISGDAAANAANADAREAARARLVEGVELLRKNQYAPALTKFDQAYALVPSPNIHYDRALAYLGLGRNADALEAFEAFLARADHPPPGTREKATRDRETLRTRVATLAVTTDPPGAEVTIDGRLRGVTPLGGSLYLDPGPHEVVARNAATGAAAAERIVASPRQALGVTLRLSAAGARSLPASPPPAQPVASGEPTAVVASPVTDGRAASGAPEPRAGLAANPWALSAAGLGVALLGAGITFAFLVDREENRVHEASVTASLINTDSTDSTHKQFAGAAQRSESNGLKYQTLETVFFATGAVALTGGIALYVFNRRSGSRADGEARSTAASGPRLSGAPIVAPTLAGAQVQLSF
jgi:hypothetical protein